jgi:hypothetical protein
MAIICPNCGVATAFVPKVIEDQHATLPDYSTRRQTLVFGTARVKALIASESPDFTGYAICVCQNCSYGYVAVQRSGIYAGWAVAYPMVQRAVAVEVPEILRDEFNEVELCCAVGAFRACVAMCQRVLESLCQDKNVAGLNELLEEGHISKALFNRATQIRLWAGLTKHKPIAEPVTREDADQLAGYLRAILEHVYVEPAKLDALEEKRKELGKK